MNDFHIMTVLTIISFIRFIKYIVKSELSEPMMGIKRRTNKIYY